jgi:hypothetical protein
MFTFITLENVLLFLSKAGIDTTLFSNFELSMLFILGNILFIIIWGFILSICYKIVTRIIHIIF